MKGERIIVGLVLAVVLTACSTTEQVPIDDVYYWSAAQKAVTSAASEPSDPSTPSSPSDPGTPSDPNTPSQPGSTIEYVNVQDTTVTIRIK